MGAPIFSAAAARPAAFEGPPRPRVGPGARPYPLDQARLAGRDNDLKQGEGQDRKTWKLAEQSCCHLEATNPDSR